MEGKLRQTWDALLYGEKLILSEEETTSAGGCGVSLAVFSRPGEACPWTGFAGRFFYLAEEQIRSVWRERRLFRLPPDGSMGAPMYGTTAYKKKLT